MDLVLNKSHQQNGNAAIPSCTTESQHRVGSEPHALLCSEHMVRCLIAQLCQLGTIRVGSFPSVNVAEYKL